VFSAAGVESKAQERNPPTKQEYGNSLDFCPMSPISKIYAIHYCRRITPNSGIIAGPHDANIRCKDTGNADAPGFIAG
jgi:hypothetical protein